MAVKPKKDYYKILQVDPSAEPEIIKAAFKRLALLVHPDRNKSEDATALFMEINEAYENLITPYKRAQYDRERNIVGEKPGRSKPAPVAAGSVKDGSSQDKPKSPPGTSPNQAKGKKNKMWLWLGIVVLVIIAFGMGILLTSISLLPVFLSSPNPLAPLRTAFVQVTPVANSQPKSIIPEEALLPSLGVNYKQVYQAYLSLGDFEFSAIPETLANDQVRYTGNSSSGKYKSNASVILEGYPKEDQGGLCRAAAVVNISAKEENASMLRFLKEMPMIITPSWSGNEWLAAGLAKATKSPDLTYTETTNFQGLKIIWSVNLKNNALGLTFESACASK